MPKSFLKSLSAFLVFALIAVVPIACDETSSESSVEKKTVSNSPAKTFTDSNGIEFVLIPAGSFMMGCDKNFDKCLNEELPRHKVSIAKPFYMSKYEITQDQYFKVMGSNPSKYKGRTRPVENVNWHEAMAFCKKAGGRLPTEEEWEYAARASSDGKWSFGDDESELVVYAWYFKESEVGTSPVGKRRPNAWGLYDVHGNVWEWTSDCWSKNYASPDDCTYRVLRGGSWYGYAQYCRSAYRTYDFYPAGRFGSSGFRLVRDIN